jgi:hypothetical protein
VGAAQADDTIGEHRAEAPPLRFPTPDLKFHNPNQPVEAEGDFSICHGPEQEHMSDMIVSKRSQIDHIAFAGIVGSSLGGPRMLSPPSPA